MHNYYHPLSLLLYFTSMIGITMFIANPIFMLISIICSLLFYLSLTKFRLDYKSLIWNIIFFILISLTNPLFSHNGVTKLFYINNNAITLEAILYGVNIALMISAIIQWFKCINLVLTQEKILYLFSRISPKLALVISNSLRFIPMLKCQTTSVKASQKTMGLYADDNYLDKLKADTRAFSCVTTYGLEKAIEIGKSMDARGYGLKKRTYYSNYKFKANDVLMILSTLTFDLFIIISKACGKLDFTFYPSIKYTDINGLTITGIIAYLLLSIMPFIIEIKEGLKWKYYESKI